MSTEHQLPPSQDYQLALQTAFAVMTIGSISFGSLRTLRLPTDVPPYHFIPTLLYCGIALQLLRIILRSGTVVTPAIAAWHGTGVGGMIFGMLVMTFVAYRGGEWIFAPLLGAFVGFAASMIVGMAGLALAWFATLLTGTRSPWVLGTLCGGTSGFLCIAPFIGDMNHGFAIASATALIGGICSTYAVHLCLTAPPRPVPRPIRSFAPRDEVRCTDIAPTVKTDP